MAEFSSNNCRRVSRRAFVSGTAAAAITIGLPPPVRAQGTTTIVSTIFGGAFEAAYRKHVVEPFQKMHNAEVILKYGTSSEWVANSILNRDQPEIDVIFLAYPDSIRAVNEGLGMTLTPDVFCCGVDLVGPSNLFTLIESVPPYWEPQIAVFRQRHEPIAD